MELQWILAILFVIGNALDLYTTYLNVKLPIEYRGEEMNPLFKKDVDNNRGWWKSIVMKVLICTYIFWIASLPAGIAVFPIKLVTIAIWLVVADNAYLVIAKRIKKRYVPSIGRFLTKTLRLPVFVAYFITMIVLFSLSYGIALL